MNITLVKGPNSSATLENVHKLLYKKFSKEALELEKKEKAASNG